jgi:hypothetical protein
MCAFQARFPDGSPKVVFSLVPGESSAEKGLRYTLFSRRLADFIGSDENAILEQLPPDPEPYELYRSGGPEFKGLAGYVKSEDDVCKIAGLLKKGPRADAET